MPTFSRADPGAVTGTTDEAADLINEGSRVAILAGRGCLKPAQKSWNWRETVGGPVIKALLGKAVVPDREPYTTGGIGLLGTAPSQDALQECDTLIIAGSGFPYLDFYPKPGKAKAVQIDVSPTRIGLRYPVEVGLVGDCRSVLRALLPLIEKKNGSEFIETCQKRMQSWNAVDGRARRADGHADEAAGRHLYLNKLLHDGCHRLRR